LIANEIGNEAREAFARAYMSFAEVAAGDLGTALADADRAMQIFVERKNQLFTIWPAFTKLLIAARRGDLATADQGFGAPAPPPPGSRPAPRRAPPPPPPPPPLRAAREAAHPPRPGPPRARGPPQRAGARHPRGGAAAERHRAVAGRGGAPRRRRRPDGAGQ